MKAFVTSIGEPTTELCVWSLERNGFEVVLLQSDSNLADKLKDIYSQAEDDFFRVDADVIPNRLCRPPLSRGEYWWYQYQCFDWYSQDISNGGVQLVKRECLPALRANIGRFMHSERPETELYRLPEFDNPRRCITIPHIVGLHGYAQTDLDRVKAVKERRNQSDNYDWELLDRINQL